MSKLLLALSGAFSLLSITSLFINAYMFDSGFIHSKNDVFIIPFISAVIATVLTLLGNANLHSKE